MSPSPELTPERWRQIKAVFGEVDSAPVEDRDAMLERLCYGDGPLREEVERLLSNQSVGSLIHRAIAEQAGSLNRTMPRQERFGPYQLVRRIGQGGMGAVFEALRVDDFRKKVALKIIKQGFDSDFARAHFQLERQLLAAIEHPYVARLLDGGETEDGSPYLVLEFVEGEPIDQYAARLDQTSRLQLFLKVCEAVDHAHRNMVIHRDLKPANILVTAAGEPKLLDFGIAKLLDPGATLTQTGLSALTPGYASPEQVSGKAISAATDVYSLGVILYQLLTGRRPYVVEAGAPVELARVICVDPPKPPGLRNDLDHILLMALRKEPERRYATVRQFADDIERWLEHRPVVARPDSVSYRASRFLRRNWVAAAAAALVIGSLTAGLAVAVKAERRTQARFNQVRQLATRFLFEFDRDIRDLPGATAAREHLVRTATEQLDSLARDASGDPGLLAELIQAYQSLADVQGSAVGASLGHTDQQIATYRKACTLAQQLLARNRAPANPDRRLAALVYSRLGYALYLALQDTEARLRIQEALALLQPRLDSGRAEADDFRVAANAHAYLSTLEGNSHHARLASEHSAQAVALMRKYQANTPGIAARSNLSRALTIAGASATTSGELERGEKLIQEAISMREAIRGEEPLNTENRRELAVAEMFLANVEYQPEGPSLGHQAEGIEASRKYVTYLRELVAADARNVSYRHSLGLSLKELGDLEPDPVQAESEMRESLKIMEALPPSFKQRERHIGLVWAALSSVLRKQGRIAEADAALSEAPRWFAHDNPRDAVARGDFLRLWAEQGEYTKIWEALSPSLPDAAEDIGVAYDLASCAHKLAKSHPEAGAAWNAKAVEVWAPWRNRYPAVDRQLEKP